MTAIVVNGSTTFGGMSNSMVDNLNAVNAAIVRLQAAVADAQSGAPSPVGAALEGGNFGVVPSATPGAQGAAYAFALNTLANSWTTFWTNATASISALDNG